jgi:hypothetical protein
MSYAPENQELDKVTEELKVNLKDYRERAENRIMDTSTWNTTHRLKLKSIIDKMFELQIDLNEL